MDSEPVTVTPAWTPYAWALWTMRLHRPGRLDDEEIPVEADVGPFSSHVAGLFGQVVWLTTWDRGRRPDWPALEWGQRSAGPAPTDACNVEGRCNGSCKRWEETTR